MQLKFPARLVFRARWTYNVSSCGLYAGTFNYKGGNCGSHLHEYAVDGDCLKGRTTHVWGLSMSKVGIIHTNA